MMDRCREKPTRAAHTCSLLAAIERYRSDMLLLVAGTTLAMVLLRRTRAVVPRLVLEWSEPARVTLSVAAGLVIGIPAQLAPAPIAP
jgi:hypothetical protein